MSEELQDIVNFDEKKLWRVIGINARKARDIAGLTQQEAQQQIFNYENKQMHANRISELENGSKKVDVKVLYKMAIVYGCSVDYLMGISAEFERDYAASHNGIIHQSMRGMMLEIGDRLSSNLSALISYFPPFQGEMLKGQARTMINLVNSKKHDMVFRAAYPDLIHASKELESALVMTEKVIARQMRIIESTMIEQIDAMDQQQIASMTSNLEASKPTTMAD